MDMYEDTPLPPSPASPVNFTPFPCYSMRTTVGPKVTALIEHYCIPSQLTNTVGTVRSTIVRHGEEWASPSITPLLESETYQPSEAWLPLFVLASFQKIRQYSEDLNFIADVLGDSNYVELSPDRRFVRRRPGANESATVVAKEACSVQVRGFTPDVSVADITHFFGSVGEVQSVVPIPRLTNPLIMDTHLVRFSQPDSIGKAVKHLRIYQDRPLYYTRIIPNIQKSAKSRKKNGSGQLTAPSERCSDTTIQVLHIEPSSTHADIRRAFVQYAKIHSIDYHRDDTSGYLRLSEPGAKELVEKLRQLNPRVNGYPVELRALEAESERMYWDTVREYRQALTTTRTANPKKPMPRRKSNAAKAEANALAAGQAAGAMTPLSPTAKPYRPATGEMNPNYINTRLSKMLNRMRVEPKAVQKPSSLTVDMVMAFQRDQETVQVDSPSLFSSI
ncbi:hypothetical protein BJ085DRAFT_28342 [Dimargaris cristalligena]|uniref:Uncharacterized protein n=1 Tax=Dimargaris cristalligena TaxID=215637 RepID=A0A4P9ZMW2_9FUNG|nr:hypothetical protein BJ085DRAFT_28342 [Dimargaris cristalligena]|eukprot:RKP34734.1 hypothetical protein BJ085DRAFT_28342 [Dimargaris cristalligena]